MPPLRWLFGDEARILGDSDFQVLLLASILPVLGTSMLSPILDSLVGPFGATPATIGWLVSIYTAPAIVVSPLAGVLADRLGRKRVMVVSITLFGIGGTAIALTTDFRVVLGLRLLQGIGVAGIAPIIVTSIGDLYSRDTGATGQGIRIMVAGLSGTVFPLIAAVAILAAWQFPFLLYAVSFPVAIGVYLWFEEPVSDQAPPDADEPYDVSYYHTLMAFASHAHIAAVIVGRSLIMAVWYAFLTYNSFIAINVFGGTAIDAGILATTSYLVSAIVAGQAGRVAGFVESWLVLLLAANTSLSVGFVVVLFSANLWQGLAGITLSAIGFGLLGALYRTIITGLAPKRLRAGIVSVSEAGSRLVATLTPLAMGAVIGVATPSMGATSALQFAGTLVAIVGGVGGGTCLLVAMKYDDHTTT